MDTDALFNLFADVGRAQVATAQAAHDARQPEIEHLKKIISGLVKQMEDAVDLDQPSFADPRCRECTHGTTPDSWQPRQCAYHQAKKLGC